MRMPVPRRRSRSRRVMRRLPDAIEHYDTFKRIGQAEEQKSGPPNAGNSFSGRFSKREEEKQMKPSTKDQSKASFMTKSNVKQKPDRSRNNPTWKPKAKAKTRRAKSKRSRPD